MSEDKLMAVQLGQAEWWPVLEVETDPAYFDDSQETVMVPIRLVKNYERAVRRFDLACDELEAAAVPADG